MMLVPLPDAGAVLMGATRNPETMTEAERRAEIASILACGMLRSIRNVRRRASANLANTSDSNDSRLDLSADSPLSVAPRPAG